MPGEAIKLFATRAERYPQPDGADVLHSAGRAAVSLIPAVGSPINELLSVVLTPALQRRRDEWLKELANAVDRLGAQFDGLKPENLTRNEAFISATVQGSRLAVATHQQEKRDMLRNAVLNIAIGRGPSEDLQQTYLNAVEAFSCSHVKVLNFLWKGNPNLRPHMVHTFRQAIQTTFAELRGESNFLDSIFLDLRNRGFSILSGADASFPQAQVITAMGIDFLRFVASPEEES